MLTLGISVYYYIWAAFALFSLVEMSFSCTSPCNGTYTTKPGLNRHQYNCPIYRTSQALKIEQRRATVTLQNRTHKPRSAGIIKLGARKTRIAGGSSEPKLVSLFVSHSASEATMITLSPHRHHNRCSKTTSDP